MNSDTLKGQWKQVKGAIRKQWGKLTDDDIDAVNGSYEQLMGKIQEKYGVGKEKAREMINRLKSG